MYLIYHDNSIHERNITYYVQGICAGNFSFQKINHIIIDHQEFLLYSDYVIEIYLWLQKRIQKDKCNIYIVSDSKNFIELQYNTYDKSIINRD